MLSSLCTYYVVCSNDTQPSPEAKRFIGTLSCPLTHCFKTTKHFEHQPSNIFFGVHDKSVFWQRFGPQTTAMGRGCRFWARWIY